MTYHRPRRGKPPYPKATPEQIQQIRILAQRAGHDPDGYWARNCDQGTIDFLEAKQAIESLSRLIMLRSFNKPPPGTEE